MGTGAVIAMVVGALVTVLGLAALTARIIQRASRALREATAATHRVATLADELAAHQAVTARELDHLDDALQRLRASRGGEHRP